MAAMSVVGYRFHPTDEELINHYLRLKNNGKESEVQVIPEVDLRKLEPWDLPGLSVIKSDDPEWFFFSSRNQKYPKGHRFDRSTKAGYWKATGNDRPIKSRSSGMKLIGMKKTLVFYKGRAPNGERTAWMIHEYHMSSEKCAYVLCRLFNKDAMVEYSNYDEMEVFGSTSNVTGSSPEDMPSNQPMVQLTSESDMKVREQLAGIARCLADKSDIITSSTLVPEERDYNTDVPSDVEDCEAEEEWLSFLNEPINGVVKNSNYDEVELIGSSSTAARAPEGMLPNQPMLQSNFESNIQLGEQPAGIEKFLDDKLVNITADSPVSEEEYYNDLSPLHAEFRSSYMDSSFASNFDDEHNEMLFQVDDYDVGLNYPILRPVFAVHSNQAEHGEHQMIEEISQENNEAAKPRVVEDVGEATKHTMTIGTIELQSLSLVDFGKDEEISQEPNKRFRLRSRSRWNAEHNDAKPTVTGDVGEATERTMTIEGQSGHSFRDFEMDKEIFNRMLRSSQDQDGMQKIITRQNQKFLGLMEKLHDTL